MSLSSNASNVLLAKCRAKYGRHLSEQEIDALVNCRSVAEAASCLRSNEHYGRMLTELDEGAVYRLRVEALVEKGFYRELSSLCRYELQVGEWFSSYTLMKGEIELIISFLLHLQADTTNEFIVALPELFIQQSDIDFVRLTQCRTYSDFLDVMDRTRFAAALRRTAPRPGKRPDFALIEHALYNDFYNTIFSIIEKHYSGKARSELTDFLGVQLDLFNFAHIWRLKKYYNTDPAVIRTLVFDRTGCIGRRTLDSMIAAPDADAVLDIFLQRTPYRRKFDMHHFEECGIESPVNMIIYEKALRLLRTSVNPTTVLLAYITLAETEMRDVITIIESVFYHLPPDEIKLLITIADP